MYGDYFCLLLVKITRLTALCGPALRLSVTILTCENAGVSLGTSPRHSAMHRNMQDKAPQTHRMAESRRKPK